MLLAELRSDRLVRIGDAGAGGNARRSVDIPPSLFQYRNFPFIRFDSCAILLGFSRHRPFFFSDCAGNAPPVRRFMRMLRRDPLRPYARSGIARTTNHRASDPAIGTIGPVLPCLPESGAHVLGLANADEIDADRSGTFWNRKSWGASTSSEEKQKCVLILRSRQPPR